MSERIRTKNDLGTPGAVLELVRRVGPVGIDPCSNEWSKVGARVAFDGLTIETNGLLAPWFALLRPGELAFVNPPYGRSHMRKWADKITHEARLGCEVIALVKGDFSTKWWTALRKEAKAVCYVAGRPAFEGGDHKGGKFASALFYFGTRPHLFAHVFGPLGDVRIL